MAGFRAAIFMACAFVLSIQMPAHAQEVISRDMVAEKYERWETLMNKTDKKRPLIAFLHNHISPDARFHISVSNPVMNTDGQLKREMSKEDYINSYVRGNHFVADYNIDIRTSGFRYDPENKIAITRDLMIETGTMRDPQTMEKTGRPFVSRTTCETRHELRSNKLVSLSGDCHTAISYEEFI